MFSGPLWDPRRRWVRQGSSLGPGIRAAGSGFTVRRRWVRQRVPLGPGFRAVGSGAAGSGKCSVFVVFFYLYLFAYPLQECRRVPAGDSTTTEEYFAGSHLSFSLFVARIWTASSQRWLSIKKNKTKAHTTQQRNNETTE